MLLEAHGYEVHIAASGEQALAMLQARDYTLLIADCVMPDLTGPQISKLIKADPGMAALPVLLMSASLGCDVGADSGDSFLRKPFRAENLVIEVRKLLQTIAPVAGSLAKV